MALDASVLVDLPEHGIAYKKVSGKTYVYYVTATYRNKNGNPTCDRSSIGRLDETSGKLIPNRNYYEIFLKQPIPPAGDLFCCGFFDVFDRVCDSLGIKKTAEAVFSGALQGDPDGGTVRRFVIRKVAIELSTHRYDPWKSPYFV